ncbi:MAG: type II toxin-antitoxin system HicA family toxin [Fimbriimonadia bacterium]|jgi:predicted RNA binding protein YcfA (HicA-like mRNA interferase family)
MRLRELEKYLRERGCERVREGAKHTIYRNPVSGKTAPVPRHHEIGRLMVRRICLELAIQPPATD